MGKVTRFMLEQFTAFSEPQYFNFCPGINVLIGANSTGKTHLMKAMYATLKICEESHRSKMSSSSRIVSLAEETLSGVFKSEIGQLVRHQVGRNSGKIELWYDDQKVKISITSPGKLTVEPEINLPQPEKSVFLPVHEFLSIYPGFIAAYQNRETSFDQTYYDLAVALSANPLRGAKLDEIKNLLTPLKKAVTGIRVTREEDQFYVHLPEGKFGAALVSEGYRKLAGLLFLLNNGSLTQNGILFWDEPEANLNPKLVTGVVKTLQILAASGMQIFIATHDYLISQELSLLAEYDPSLAIRFFALHQPGRKEGVTHEEGHSLAEIENNPILEEFAAHYDREAELFEKRSG